MAVLQIIYAPNPIFQKKCALVSVVDDSIRRIVDNMLATMEHERAVGLGANMVGVLKSIAVVNLNEEGVPKPYVFINPEITWSSDDLQIFEEASLSFPGVSADIARPASIELKYLDYEGNPQTLKAHGFLASVIQHEVDYLNGKIFLDYLSKMKREMLIKKMEKYIKMHPPHVHGAHCHH